MHENWNGKIENCCSVLTCLSFRWICLSYDQLILNVISRSRHLIPDRLEGFEPVYMKNSPDSLFRAASIVEYQDEKYSTLLKIGSLAKAITEPSIFESEVCLSVLDFLLILNFAHLIFWSSKWVFCCLHPSEVVWKN